MVPRVVRELFGQIATATAAAGGGGGGGQAAARSFTVRMSMMEIYNEVGVGHVIGTLVVWMTSSWCAGAIAMQDGIANAVTVLTLCCGIGIKHSGCACCNLWCRTRARRALLLTPRAPPRAPHLACRY